LKAPALPDPSPRLVYRRFRTTDAPRVLYLCREEEYARWLPDQVYSRGEEALKAVRRLARWNSRPGDPGRAPFVLGVCLAGTLELTGHVGLSPLRGGVEVGYAVESRRCGMGLATEAVTAVTDWALIRFRMEGILGIVHEDNPASIRVLEKSGFVLVDMSPGVMHGRRGLVRTYLKKPPSPAALS
jgi:RimJ/RimL family protein N-acetyltransferase